MRLMMMSCPSESTEGTTSMSPLSKRNYAIRPLPSTRKRGRLWADLPDQQRLRHSHPPTLIAVGMCRLTCLLHCILPLYWLELERA
jgi:hypothetical protein